MDILTALDDDQLFQPHFRPSSWRRWRAFLKALFALPMDEAEQAIYQEHTGRTDLPERPYTEAALVVGRRGGKSRILATCAVYLATCFDYSAHLARNSQTE